MSAERIRTFAWALICVGAMVVLVQSFFAMVEAQRAIGEAHKAIAYSKKVRCEAVRACE